MEMADALNDVLSSKWRNLRGLEIVSFGVSSVKASEEDEAMLKELQRNAAFMDPTRAAAHLVGAQASAMQAAANNQNAGPAMAFMGMNMAGQAGGVNAQSLYQMGGAAAGSPRCGRLDVRLWPERHHRQVLPELRQAQACPCACRWKLDMLLRCDGDRKVLPGMRQTQTGGYRLDVLLRCSEQGQVLRRVRQAQARRNTQVQVRQVRLGAQGPDPSAKVLPGMRRSV